MTTPAQETSPIKLFWLYLLLITALAGGVEFCYGEGWTKFVGSGPPMAATAVASLLAAAGFAGLLFNVRPARSWRA